MLTSPQWLDLAAWPFAPRTLATSNGAMHYVDEGDGPLVVLVHGTPTWSFEWRHVIRDLRTTHRVLAPDHLGFGLSSRPRDAGYRPEDHARRFAEWYDGTVGRRAATVVVHDFGGPIALPTILDRIDQVDRLVIVNSWAWDMGQDPTLRGRIAMVQGWIGRLLYRHANASQRLLMPSAYANRGRLTSAIHRQYLEVFADADGRERVLYALAKSLAESSAFFDGLWARRQELQRIPATILWGTRDGALPDSILERWKQGLPGATVREFPDAGHWPHEERPDDFIGALRAVLPSERSS